MVLLDREGGCDDEKRKGGDARRGPSRARACKAARERLRVPAPRRADSGRGRASPEGG